MSIYAEVTRTGPLSFCHLSLTAIGIKYNHSKPQTPDSIPQPRVWTEKCLEI